MIYWYNPYVVDYPSPGGFPIGKSNSEDWDMVTGQVQKESKRWRPETFLSREIYEYKQCTQLPSGNLT